MFSKLIKLFIGLCVFLFIGCSSNNKNLEKNKDLFVEENSELEVSEPFILKEQQIILKKSKFIKKNGSFKKIDLGSL
ncbi:hypothetical protein [Halarcobacter ebronensis]|uniref:Lipoprotein n=1 Tax=Halarcobacter ebronensis TaxID=1462615 RepID=A0A4V1M0R2_9BACT|nr:hypothetical protein [Halarcobacter ebronensis]QKF82402.1 hypothetical protein AEBR_1922 [Halarcobacter ebronensis]RXK07575.1 hypothetical protein CRV07_03690 [Halarcobacter ebronensis]